MIIELLRISAPPGKTEEFANTVVALVDPIEVQPGRLSCRVFQAWPQRDGLLIEARWESQEYLVRYLRSQIYRLYSWRNSVRLLLAWSFSRLLNFVAWIWSNMPVLHPIKTMSQLPARLG